MKKKSENLFIANRGATLVEVLIASALLTILAASLLPSFTFLRKQLKLNEFKQLCMTATRHKLSQYLSGKKIGRDYLTLGPTEAGSLAMPFSINTVNGSSVFYGEGLGFFFLKYIYNLRAGDTSPYACISSQERLSGGKKPILTQMAGSSDRYLGSEEAIGNIVSSTGSSGVSGPQAQCSASPISCGDIDSGCPCPEDQSLQNQTGGRFRIYVLIQRVLGQQSDCPMEGGATFPSLYGARNSSNSEKKGAAQYYDFDGGLDQIRITASGVLDLYHPSSPGFFAGFAKDSIPAQQLNCSLSETVALPSNIYRYTLGTYAPSQVTSDVTALGWPSSSDCHQLSCNSAILDRFHRPSFRSLWNENIRSFLVAPNNRAFYLLTKGGQLYRYGNESLNHGAGQTCLGAPTECTTDGGYDSSHLLTPTLIADMPNMKAFGIRFTQTSQITGSGINDAARFEPQTFLGLIENQGKLEFLKATYSTSSSLPLSMTGIDPSAWDASIFFPVPQTPPHGFLSFFSNFALSQAYILTDECSNQSETENSIYCKTVYSYQDGDNLTNASPLENLSISTRAVSP